MKDYEHGFGTSPQDELFRTRGQARRGFFDWVATLFGGHGNVPPPIRSEDGRTVTYKDESRGVTVTVRSDRNDPKVHGSIDTSSKIRRPNGRVVGTNKHFGYEED